MILDWGKCIHYLDDADYLAYNEVGGVGAVAADAAEVVVDDS